MSNIAEVMTACQAQAVWMENSAYQWQSYPTIPKSRYKGTCVTYVACVLQRLNILQPGQYIWHDTSGRVTGANSQMQVIYVNDRYLHAVKNQLLPGDIIMDGNKHDDAGGSHIFIITGQWNGDNPIVWDNHSGQEQLMDYEYTRNRPVIAIVRLFGIAFVPRLTRAGMLNNPYWYSRNPFYLAGYGLPNCTCYAFGRWWEIADVNNDYSNYPALSTGNAEDWYGYTQDGYERGSTPRLGAVACWADGPFSGDGHVAVVEEIDPDTGEITCSNSAYGGEYFYLTHLNPPDYLPAAGYVFQGFIYNPYSGGVPWGGGSKAWMFKRSLWHREEDLIK